MGLDLALLKTLGDGRFHSGQALAASARVSRAAIWKRVQRLRGAGLDIFAVSGHGYRLAHELEWLDEGRLREYFGAIACRVELPLDVGSTNTVLMQQALQPDMLHLCACEWQRAGRGRRGKRWVSPPVTDLCFSLARCSRGSFTALSAFSLVGGVAVIDALRALGIEGIALKWPNDIVQRDSGGVVHKLGGILIEISGSVAADLRWVMGIGLNLEKTADWARTLGQSVKGLRDVVDTRIGRNELLAQIVKSWLCCEATLEQSGLATVLERWRRYDAYLNQPLSLLQGTHTLHRGLGRGIDARGQLLVDIDGRRQAFNAGEISLRVDAAHATEVQRAPD